MRKAEKIFVGLSGGVDSSVSAALLKDQGYDVTGVFIKVWQPEGFSCTWKEDRLDAMRVAAKLDIPFVTLDLEKEYKQEVIDYMFNEYEQGRTPNPDVMCNKTVKFGAFLDWALEHGADFVATGHYARKLAIEVKKSAKSKEKEYALLMGADANKDQSYFLWTLTQKQLQHIMFPIGEYEKAKVRELAEQFGLSTAKKKDSQGLCFVGKLDMKEFLKEYIDVTPGDVLDTEGRVVGRHDGAVLYTNGQRHGYTTEKQEATTEPFYVIDKNIKQNTITVAHQQQRSEGQKQEVLLKDIVWTSGTAPDDGQVVTARVRYRQDLQEAILRPQKNTIAFVDAQTVSSGQSVVIYDGQHVLGGGIII